MDIGEKIFIAGRYGLVGSSLERVFRNHGFTNIVGLRSVELDLRRQADVAAYFESERPAYVVFAAARVGGIMANIQSPAEFMYDNLSMQNNIIHSAYENRVKKLLFFASSCVYPRLAPQPMKEEYLLSGKLEPTNEGYAIAKIAGLKMCQMYNRQFTTNNIAVMPCNIYGIGDNFDLDKAHVVGALIRKFHEAKLSCKEYVDIWGTGNARRELMFSEDMADACFHLFSTYSEDEFINVGTGRDVSIAELANVIQRVVDFAGEIKFDPSKPEGMPQKLMDVSRLRGLGWTSKTGLEEGISRTYEWFLNIQRKKGLGER